MNENTENLIARDEKIQKFIESLPEDILEKAKAATSKEELKELIDNYDGFVPLTDEELEMLAGGCNFDDYGDAREDFDSSRMDESFLRGEDLGF